MVERTNVNGAHFLEDWILNEDYRRDVNADELAIRDLSKDVYGGGPIIFEGLTLEPGSNPDTLKIKAGRARDGDHRHVVLPIDVDNFAENVEPDGYNYVAVKHELAYSGFRAAVKTGNGYQAVCADHYQIHVSTGPHLEGEGWINLGLAVGQGGTWTFAYDTTSRSVEMMPMQMRNGFSILSPYQELTDEWEDFGDQRFILASWSWANTFIHVILADGYGTAQTHLYEPQIDKFVDFFGVAANTGIYVGDLRDPVTGLPVSVELCYQNEYLKIRTGPGTTANAYGIIHYCGGPYVATP
jgi:hypothetical protein